MLPEQEFLEFDGNKAKIDNLRTACLLEAERPENIKEIVISWQDKFERLNEVRKSLSI